MVDHDHFFIRCVNELEPCHSIDHRLRRSAFGSIKLIILCLTDTILIERYCRTLYLYLFFCYFRHLISFIYFLHYMPL